MRISKDMFDIIFKEFEPVLTESVLFSNSAMWQITELYDICNIRAAYDDAIEGWDIRGDRDYVFFDIKRKEDAEAIVRFIHSLEVLSI